MAAKLVKKSYQGSIDTYSAKLKRVMERFGIPKDGFEWNYDRFGAHVAFVYKGKWYRFEQTIESAKTHGVELRFGKDCFAQIVLALEKLVYMVELGIYDLDVWISGMKSLPPATHIPDCFQKLGFDEIPKSVAEIEKAYRQKSLEAHPDHGGSDTTFHELTVAKEKALQLVEAVK